ncbi:MAG: hypothetical protein ABR974_11035 [Bacteroidales bacterium]|jgi:hypothetical protein
MKKLAICFFTVSMTILLFNACRSKADLSGEQESIKAVIKGEINASCEGDYDKWTTFFVHEPYVLFLQANKNYYLDLKGWDTLSVAAKNWIRPSRKGTILFGGNSNYVFRISGNIAWVSFTTTSTLTSDCGESKLVGIEVRTLEKHEGSWKIAYLGSVYSSTYEGKNTDN